MKSLRIAFPHHPVVGSASAAANPKYDEDWSAFGNVLTLVQQMIRIGNHPYPDQAMADLLAGRNPEANQAIASLFAGATAEMPPEYRDRMRFDRPGPRRAAPASRCRRAVQAISRRPQPAGAQGPDRDGTQVPRPRRVPRRGEAQRRARASSSSSPARA